MPIPKLYEAAPEAYEAAKQAHLLVKQATRLGLQYAKHLRAGKYGFGEETFNFLSVAIANLERTRVRTKQELDSQLPHWVAGQSLIILEED